MNPEKLKAILLTLDPDTAEHWTADGLPRIDTVSELAGETVVRQQVTDAFPGFSREQAVDEFLASVAKPKDDSESISVVGAEANLLVVPEGTAEMPAEFHALVAIKDDVVEKPAGEVYADVDLMDRAIAEYTRQHAILTERLERIREFMLDRSQRCQRLEAHRARMAPSSTSSKASVVQQYQAAQLKLREEKAARVAKFLKAGTTPQEVLKELQTSSPLDASLKQRKRTPAG